MCVFTMYIQYSLRMEEALNSMKMEVQLLMSFHVGSETELESYTKSANAPNCSDISILHIF